MNRRRHGGRKLSAKKLVVYATNSECTETLQRVGKFDGSRGDVNRVSDAVGILPETHTKELDASRYGISRVRAQ